MKKLLVSAVSMAALTGAATAADLPSRKEPVAAPLETPSWNGFYAGLNAGGTWANNNTAKMQEYPLWPATV